MNDDKLIDGCLKILGVLVLAGVVFVLSPILHGWALSLLWGWFFVPTLGLPSLSIVQAIGVSIVVSFLTARYAATDDKDKGKDKWEKFAQAIIYAVLHPLAVVGIGYVVRGFM